jgi:RNA polymerase sigma factor for flagellar operon FliA
MKSADLIRVADLVCEVIGDDLRARLILEHMPQVRLIARRIQGRLPENVSLEDLVSTGVLGLISAIDRFDPRHNVKLNTYAEHRIRGAILDGLRGTDWAPRQIRRKAKQIAAATSVVEQRLQRLATEGEIAAQLELPIEKYHLWLVEIRGLNVASLDGLGGEHGGDLLHYIPDSSENLPSTLLERSELKRLLAEDIGGIPEMERKILSLYYRGELTLREIARVVHRHESRISQLKSQAILRLRSHLVPQWPALRGVMPP